MSFRFRKRIKIAFGSDVNKSNNWPSLSIGGQEATFHVSRRGPHAASGIPGNGLSWQFGGPRHIHKAIQAQADVKAVHAQGTAKAVEAQAYIIAITNRLETVAKKLTKNAPGSAGWKKAAVEQARLLDEMLDVAKESENDLLISAVRKCQGAWGNDDLHIRAALNSGMPVSECLTNMLAGRRADENLVLPLLGHLAPDTNNACPAPIEEPIADRNPSIVGQTPTGRSLPEAATWAAFGEKLARNLILLAIGCAVVAAVYMIAAHKPITRPQVALVGSEMAMPAKLRSPTPLVGAETPTTTPAATPAILAATLVATPPTTSVAIPAATSVDTPPAPAAAAPLHQGQDMHGKPVRSKHSSHSSTRGYGQ